MHSRVINYFHKMKMNERLGDTDSSERTQDVKGKEGVLREGWTGEGRGCGGMGEVVLYRWMVALGEVWTI